MGTLERLSRFLAGTPPTRIDRRIAYELGHEVVARMKVHATWVPDYRFVDLYRATEAYCRERGGAVTIESEHGTEDLNEILHSEPGRWASWQIKGAKKVAWPVAPGQEEYFPIDVFWLCRGRSAPDGSSLVVRLRYVAESASALLEAASDRPDLAERCVSSIIESSARNSIYRNQVIELSDVAPNRDEQGNIRSGGPLRIVFKALEVVDEDDMVIDDDVRRMLWRNVIDLHHRREMLKDHKVPVRRGVLLYGPPGTGKTYACRYLCGRLTNATRIIATGPSLFQVSAIFTLARMLQPSLVILEDVDLVFSAREVNLYSSVLGDLLDHMDGLRPYEDIGFVLTTNAIERLESAVRDRPGRISQCVYFGPPGPELRARYLQHYLRPYELVNLNLEELVATSHGATQAFLKEWIHRAVQIATERLAADGGRVDLRGGDFADAMEEMTRFTPGSTGRIIGFYAKDR